MLDAIFNSGVAPDIPSRLHTLSPDIVVGYAKNTKALAVSAGLKTLKPVPPKISFPIIIPNTVASPSIHSGRVGGIIRGISIPVTKKPSFISCPLTTAKRASHAPPTEKTTIYIGKTVKEPAMNISKKPRI